jgi:hypothetical protein
MAQLNNALLQTTESWRKAGFSCAPYGGNDREDAKRFMKQFETAIDCENYNKGEWTGGDVLLGTHEGGTLNPAAGNAAAIAAKNKLALVRSKQVLAIFAKHCLNETHAERVRSFRTSAHPAEDAWRDFLATECGGATPETLEESIKAECREATILGTTGFQVGSIPHFTNWLEFRARWVFKGFTEQYGRDYEDTFIGTIVGTTQRIMCAEAARRKCTLYDCDVRAAFTTATMDRELYFEGPRPFTEKGKCCRCDKSVEGSKQAGNLYYKEHAQVFTEKIGLERSTADPNLYRKLWDDGSFLYVGVLVDNSLILPSGKDKLEWFLTQYRKHYTITGGEPTTKFNGVFLAQNVEKGTVSIHLKTYIEQVYRKYVPAPARPQLHPVESLADSHEKFMAIEPAKEPDPAMADKDYDGLVGCLGYIVAQGRPDCSFHVSWLQQFNSSPPLAAWQAAITVLLYLYHTRDSCITYGGRSDYLRCDTEPKVNMDALQQNSGLMCWSDASWGTIRSHGGHVITYMGAAICWVSRRLKVVCLSSTEAETVAGVAATKDVRFVLHILDFFGVRIVEPVPLLIDNAGMWFNIRNDGVSGRTRYWDLWMHFTREMYRKGMLEPHKVDTTEERADIFTKAMSMKAMADYFKFRNDIMNIKHANA